MSTKLTNRSGDPTSSKTGAVDKYRCNMPVSTCHYDVQHTHNHLFVKHASLFINIQDVASTFLT